MKYTKTNGMEDLLIFDTTLRDGEQSPGATMSLENKINIAKLLDEMGVDIIEAGFPIASEGDFVAVSTISELIDNAVVCGLARSSLGDIHRAGKALKKAKKSRIHTFISTSDLHMKYKLQMTREQVLEAIQNSVKTAIEYTDDVQWSPEDGTRTDHDFLCKAVEIAIGAGATTINIPDTVGYTIPNESAFIISMLRERVSGIENITLSTHCHNDLGMAVANSLAAVLAGARQVECTVNGIGERAGNAAMEEIVMATRVRNDSLPYKTRINTTKITPISRMVSDATSFPIQFNKAIVGKNAFAHEAGIHQDGMIKHANTYEIMRPTDVGLSESSLVLGKHSGRAAVKKRLNELGYEFGDNRINDFFVKFKELADRKREIYDGDLIAMMRESIGANDEDYLQVHHLKVICGSEAPQTAEMDLGVGGVRYQVESTGDGPVDAAFKGVAKVFSHNAKLKLYQVNAVTQGTDAQATVTVRLEEDGIISVGQSADTDTVYASLKAYLAALNNLIKQRDSKEIYQETCPTLA